MPLDIVLPMRVQKVTSLEISETPSNASMAHAQGFQAGYEEGKLRAEWEAKKHHQEEKKRLEQVLQSLDHLPKEFETLLQEHLPDLIHAAVNGVFRQHHFTTAEIASEVSILITEMEQALQISIECPTDALQELQARLEECDLLSEHSQWSLKANGTLKPGEFLLKSDLGDVDGRHSCRIRHIHDALKRAK